MEKPRRFKYRKVDSRGQLEGFLFSSKGRLDDTGLHLKDRLIPPAAFVQAESRDKRAVFIHLNPASGQPDGLVLEIYGVSASTLAKSYNRAASRATLDRKRRDLEARGSVHELRVEDCPCCGAAVDLSGFAQTPEVMCPYCDNVRSDAVPVKEQARVRVCDKCGFFAMPRGITCFYFYFLVFLWGFRSQRKHMCGACMRTEGWKMLAGNLLFILGVPVAITQLCRAYFGTAFASSAYKGLESGNIQARRGKADQAAERYNAIDERLGGSAIASFNKGRAFAMINRVEDATQAFEESLLRCANFGPAARGLAACYAMQQLPHDDHPLLAPFRDDDRDQSEAEQVEARA